MMKKDMSFKPAVCVSAAICFMFFMFSPLETYLTNKDEFWYDIYVLAPIMACVFLIFTAACVVGFFVLYKWNEKLYRIALLFLFITFICSYVQGNYLVKYLPVIDGSTIDWSEYARGRVESIILWIVVIAVVIILAKKLKDKQMDMIVQVVSICMVLMFMVTLGTLCMTNHGLESKTNVCVTTDREFEMSTDQNFIILLLDATDGQAFSDVVVGNPAYESVFDDFTYYDNTTSVYPHTTFNVPFLMSGIWFENKVDTGVYFHDVQVNSPVFRRLEEDGFSIALYEPDIQIDENTKDRFENVGLFTKRVSSYTTFARWQVLLTGMKYAPFDLKRFSFVNPNAFKQLRVVEGGSKMFDNDNFDFYHQLLEEGIAYRDDKSFKFIHLWGAHPPFEQDKDMNYLPEGGTYTQSLEGCITLTDTYLNALREGGVYDNSIIIIVADHGASEYFDTEYYQQHPILLIKGLDERHAFQVNDKAISFADLPDAYTKLLDGIVGGGQTVFEDLPQTRDRRFLYYDIKDPDHMTEYMQKGPAGDMSTMIPTGKEFNR